MIVLDIAAIVLVLIGCGVYREIRAVSKNARIHYRLQGLHKHELR